MSKTHISELSKQAVPLTNTSSPEPQPVTVVARDSGPRVNTVDDQIAKQIELLEPIFDQMRNGTSPQERMRAFSALVTRCAKSTHHQIFNRVFKFFNEHKNEAFLSESEALQCSDLLQFDHGKQVHIFYVIMMTLAKPRKGSRLELNTISRMFNSDFSTWVGVRCDRLGLGQKSIRL